MTRAAGSSYGHMFRITTFGESHGGGVGCVVDGVPARLNITQVSLHFCRFVKPLDKVFIKSWPFM